MPSGSTTSFGSPGSAGSAGFASGATAARRAVRAGRASARSPGRRSRCRRAARGSRPSRPTAGAGTSASTLSVEISTIVSSSATASPGCLAHSRMTPSETDSPIAGITISTASPSRPPAPVGLGLGLGLGERRRPVARTRRAAVQRDLGEQRADVHGVALGGVDLDHGARRGRGNFGVDLVRRDLDDRLVFRDGIAFLLVPFQDGSLGDRVPHRRHDHLDRGVDCHLGISGYLFHGGPG